LILAELVAILNSTKTKTDFALARNHHKLPRQGKTTQLDWIQV
jgi:hypothetical protein